MRLLIFLIFIIGFASCNTQDHSNQKQEVVDTLKLFNPTNAKNETLFEIIVARNAMLMHDSLYAVELESGQSSLMNKTALLKFLSDSSTTIRKKLFHILTDSSSSFKEIVEIIEIVKAAKIDNYKVFNFQTRLLPPEPLTVAPATSVTTHAPIDSSWLLIKFDNNFFRISLLKDSLLTVNIANIDKFFANHLDKIDEKKILLSGSNHTNYEMFVKLKKILKKYKFFQFRIVTNQQDG